ncbi:MAG: flagellar basal body P-ring formation chaperone FlgA [Thiobacillaceae bacterium]
MNISLLLKVLAVWATLQSASSPAAERQSLPQLQGLAESYLKTQTAGLPGKLSFTVNPVDVRTHLPACSTLEAFTPPGSRNVGKTTVGIRCLAPSNWAIFLPAHIRQIGNYVSAAVGLMPGQPITADSLLQRSADLGALPDDVVTEPAQVIGMNLISGIAPGAPLRQSLLRTPQVVQQNQTTRLILNGNGFVIHAEGRALTNAHIGQSVQIRTEAGQIVSGIVRVDHTVDISN